jgi:prophage DNA circulation protein
MEATTAAVEAPTTTKSTAMEAAAAHAASVSTAAAAAASVTAATTAATSECRSWLNQADRCQCEQGYNRFSHYAFPPLDEVAPRHTTLSQRDYSAIRQRSQ